MYNYFYKITNKVNNKYYFGVHKTKDLNDGYMGSGKRLNYAIEKYGIKNFDKEILDFFDTYEEALDFEAEIVTEKLVLDENCYNLRKGGSGGFTKEESLRGRKIMSDKIWNDPEYRKRHSKRSSELFKRLHKEGKIKYFDWTGRNHREESKRKIGKANAIHQKGAGNSQFGTCWITNEKESKKINKGDLIPEGWRLGRKMRRTF